MGKFSVEKKGYSISEVDDFLLQNELEQSRMLKEKQSRIDELRQENIKLTNELEEFKRQEKNISKTLIYATNKAQEIENTSKLRYELELKNLDEFYAKWQNFFDELMIKYPLMKDFDTKNVLSMLKDDINNLFKNEFHVSNLKTKPADSFENLLDKLRKHKTINRKKVIIKTNKTPDKEKIIESENEIEFLGESNKMNNIKPITNLTLSKDEQEEYDSLLDKFLHTNNNVSKGYENSILNKNKKSKKETKYPKPNESGFDLEQALNPTDDLLKIMKGFKLD